MTVLLITAITVALVLAVLLTAGPRGTRRVPPARPKRDTIQTLNNFGDDVDRLYR